MSVYKRVWKTADGEKRAAWRVHYLKSNGKRSAKQFKTKKQAVEFDKVAGVESKAMPNRAGQYFRNLFFALCGK